MRVGAHVSVAGGVDNAVSRQLDVGGNCGQIFTTSPQVWAHPEISEEQAERFREETGEKLVPVGCGSSAVPIRGEVDDRQEGVRC